jgi:hypothetical protein
MFILSQYKFLDVAVEGNRTTLAKKLIKEQYFSDTHAWQVFLAYGEDEFYVEHLADEWTGENWEVIYILLGLKTVSEDLYITQGHIAKQYFQKNVKSEAVRFYAGMVINSEDYLNSKRFLSEDIDKLIELILIQAV